MPGRAIDVAQRLRRARDVLVDHVGQHVELRGSARRSRAPCRSGGTRSGEVELAQQHRLRGPIEPPRRGEPPPRPDRPGARRLRAHGALEQLLGRQRPGARRVAFVTALGWEPRAAGARFVGPGSALARASACRWSACGRAAGGATLVFDGDSSSGACPSPPASRRPLSWPAGRAFRPGGRGAALASAPGRDARRLGAARSPLRGGSWARRPLLPCARATDVSSTCTSVQKVARSGRRGNPRGNRWGSDAPARVFHARGCSRRRVASCAAGAP